MSQKRKSGLQRGLSDIIAAQTTPVEEKSRLSSDLISKFREHSVAEQSQTAPSKSEAPPELGAPSKSAAPSEIGGQPLPITGAVKSGGASDLEGAPDFTVAQSTPHTRIVNDVWDKVMPTLKPRTQVVLWRLIRLSVGFQSGTCNVSVGKIAEMTGVAATQVRDSIKELQRRELVHRVRDDLSNSNQGDRGITIRVNIPRLAPSNLAGAVKLEGAVKSAAPSKSEANKYKDLKEINKRGVANAKDCPDCNGTGFTYPDGFERGAKKCAHPKLKG